MAERTSERIAEIFKNAGDSVNLINTQTSKGSLPGYADVSPKGKDPFGLKKPIPSSNKKC